MNDSLIVSFIQAYKDLDKLCGQIFSTNSGISAYIDEMERNTQEGRHVSYWNGDYKQLKHLRWVRNKLLHESNSFEDDIFTLEDIEWLMWFRSEILERNDPLARLNEYKESRKNISSSVKNQSSIPTSVVQTFDRYSDHIPRNSNSFGLSIIFLIVIAIAIVFVCVCIYHFITLSAIR